MENLALGLAAGKMARLRGWLGLDLVELDFVEAFGFPEVELALGVEPELGAVAEEAGEALCKPRERTKTYRPPEPEVAC